MNSEKNVIEEIRRFVEEECKKSTSKYGYDIYVFHFIPVRDYSIKLAEELNADKEVVELAAWLHDIGSIIYGRKNHHITGAEIAENKLKEFNYPQEKLEQVKHCILNHRGSQANNRETNEAKIIADADAMSHFENISGIFKAAFIYESQTQEEAKESTRQKLTNGWNKLNFEESKTLIKPKYEAAMLLLGNNNENWN